MATTNPEPAPSVYDENKLSAKIFSAFITNSRLTISEEELLDYTKNELKVDVSELPQVLKENLHLIAVTYMNLWPGWDYKADFQSGKFSKEHYYVRFQKHMSHKIKALTSNQFKSTLKSLDLSLSGDINTNRYKVAMKSTGRASDGKKNNANLEFAPYAISIQCPPHMLNTIVFSNTGDDVIMKQHLGATWQNLNPTQLINWPHIEVSFKTPDICFVRRQATEFLRYLNFLPHDCEKTDENIIEHVEILSNNYGKSRSSYTYRFLEEYVKDYLSALKQVKSLNVGKIEEITTILSQFLQDIDHINVNKTMATSTVVLFKLFSAPYIRNKKLVKNSEKDSDEARVGYCEIITPKIELVMLYCRAQQRDGPTISFELPHKIANAAPQEDISGYLPSISYKCTFCHVQFDAGDTKRGIMDHLIQEHKMEQHVRCTVCKKQFDVLNLASCRWRHKCVTPVQVVAPEVVTIN